MLRDVSVWNSTYRRDQHSNERRDTSEQVEPDDVLWSLDNAGTDQVGHEHSKWVGHDSNGGGDGTLGVREPGSSNLRRQEHDEWVGDGGDSLSEDTNPKAVVVGHEVQGRNHSNDCSDSVGPSGDQDSSSQTPLTTSPHGEHSDGNRAHHVHH